jgi:hypothetical protein
MRVEVSEEAAGIVRDRGGTLWVWTARPRVCCGGTPVQFKVSSEPPDDSSGFTQTRAGGVDIRFRAPGGRFPDVLQIALHGRRTPRVEAYWDGCLFIM